MATEAEGPPAPAARHGTLHAWLRIAAAAAALLALSEALWLWQTWPVRELLHPTATRSTTASVQ